jgi:hypothetical protein
MKKFIAVALMLTSINVFSQSYLILSNGVTLTTDKAGYVYDFNNFRLPYKVEVKGGQFLVEDEKLSTVDKNGFLYEKNFKVKKIKGNGLNYFIKNDREIVLIDASGFYYEYDKDSRVFTDVTLYGGNFFVVLENKRKKIFHLYTVNDQGNYFKVNVPGLNPADISRAGGTFFQTKTGLTYTVSKEGYVYPKSELSIGSILESGGNYFIDSTNKLFTVSDTGLVILPILPANIKVTDLIRFGSNYMLDSEGRIFTVDSDGNMFERTVNQDLNNTKVLSR